MSTATSAPVTPVSPIRTVTRQLAVDTGYVLLTSLLAVVSFTVLLSMFCTGLGLLVTVIGIPIITATLYLARGFADLERFSIPPILHRARIRPRYRKAEPGAGWLRRCLAPLAQGQPWLDLTHGILRLPVAIFSFTVVICWWAVALAGTFYGLYDWALPPSSPDTVQLHELLGMSDTVPARITFHTALGLFFLFTLPLAARGCAVLTAAFGRALLTGVAEMQDQIEVLEERRAAAVSAEATALRRLERDIHDGPQQRLIRLAMDLGRVQQQLDKNPTAARETLRDALAQTQETLTELRALSRGIAPPILVDRGLPSALAALAGRSTIPAELAVDPTLGTPRGRLDAAVENAAYFIVAEALANVAKHSDASACWLTVARASARLGIVVADNGVGGAHVAKGHGLAGLADRVHALGGSLVVDSPAGGPTEIRAELPC